MSEVMHYTCQACGHKFEMNLPFFYYTCSACGGLAVADEAPKPARSQRDAAYWRDRAEKAEADAQELGRAAADAYEFFYLSPSFSLDRLERIKSALKAALAMHAVLVDQAKGDWATGWSNDWGTAGNGKT